MIRRNGAGFRALLMGADALLAAGLLVGLSLWRFGADWAVWWRQIVPVPEGLLVIYASGWVIALTMNGLYRPRARWSIRAEVIDVMRASIVLALVTLSVLFIFDMPNVSRMILLILFPAQAAATVGIRVILRLAMERRRRQGLNLRYVLVLGAGPRGQLFAAKLEAHRELGLRVAGFLDDAPPNDLRAGWNYLGRLDRLEEVFHSQIIDEVVICLPFSQWILIDAITHQCEDEGKIVRIPMDVLDRALSVGRVEDLDGTPVFSLVSGPDRVLALAAKRALDIAVAVVGLVVLSPVFLAVAVAIRRDVDGPVLFRQTRVGLNGRPFNVLKFRTMVSDAEGRYSEVVGQSDPRAFKLTHDPRITRVGRLLRRTSLDELPQLWNVLSGEMSLVGPRPAPPREVEGYDIWHRRRLSMKPGITGLWQVTARHVDDFDNRAQLDLTYIDRWSLWLDVQILFRTIPAALEGR
jgi:exopolysaccharide biosynthesis polyprenyl glycosylphosphotransferase